MDPLSDPLGDRFMKDVKPPIHRPISHELLFPSDGNGKPSYKALKSHFQREGRIAKTDALQLIDIATNIFRSEENLLFLQDPVTIVGDIHGQLYDMFKMFEIGGNPENTKYLFLGDYVDRGVYSIEVVFLLYAIKINFPQTFYMIRGNHECRQMTTYFNFRTECIYKYDIEVYDRIMESFDCIPISCLINRKFLALHGGISPELRTIEDLTRLNRFVEPPKQGLYCDILWSDPVDTPDGRLPEGWRKNEVRGCSFYFGNDVMNNFLKRNDLISVIRGHEAQPDGFKMHRWNGNNEFPAVITIFSAPNYCDSYNNKGAIIKFDNNTLNIQQYNYNQHPYMLPNFMDVFTWSVPFILAKVVDIFSVILKNQQGEMVIIDEKSTTRFQELEDSVSEQKIGNNKNKKSVAEIMRLFQALREGIKPDSIENFRGYRSQAPLSIIVREKTELESLIELFAQARALEMRS
ncbi:unnamed protein product [Blepharisma stoltei]|uniref:Serine/threonine-protein phosphatase n=1 Tax=Blepharisma stoltei TaxID=1481888 RepID=A0AAU9JYD3_9CILI|nr:unnamed protein product [Blepharisma stoltei]